MRKSEIVLYTTTFLIGIITLLVLRQIIHYRSAIKALERKNYIEAVDGFSDVIYNHIPFSPLEKKSINYIHHVIKVADETEDYVLKLYAIEMLRRSIYGIRHLNTPHNSTLVDLNSQTIKLRSQLLIQDGYLKGVSETEDEMKSIVEKELAPNPLLAFVAILMFLGYVAFAFWNIFAHTKDEFVLKKFLAGILILLLLAFGWSIGFYLC